MQLLQTPHQAFVGGNVRVQWLVSKCCAFLDACQSPLDLMASVPFTDPIDARITKKKTDRLRNFCFVEA